MEQSHFKPPGWPSVTPRIVVPEAHDLVQFVKDVFGATADYQPNDPQIAFYLARFIEQVRSIPSDAIIVRQNWIERTCSMKRAR